MHPYFVRKLPALSLCSTFLFTACGPSDLVGEDKLSAIKPGMTRAAMAAIIGTGPLKPNQLSDTVRLYSGYRRQAFLAGGAQYDVIWYREKAGNIEEEITRERETPILLNADTVVVSGWAEFDDKAQELGIPNPYRDRERLDSMSKAQAKPAK